MTGAISSPMRNSTICARPFVDVEDCVEFCARARLDNAAKRIPANAIAKNPKTTGRSAEFLSRIVWADFICFRRHLRVSANLFRVKAVRQACRLRDAKACDQISSRCAPVQGDLAAR